MSFSCKNFEKDCEFKWSKKKKENGYSNLEYTFSPDIYSSIFDDFYCFFCDLYHGSREDIIEHFIDNSKLTWKDLWKDILSYGKTVIFNEKARWVNKHALALFFLTSGENPLLAKKTLFRECIKIGEFNTELGICDEKKGWCTLCRVRIPVNETSFLEHICGKKHFELFMRSRWWKMMVFCEEGKPKVDTPIPRKNSPQDQENRRRKKSSSTPKKAKTLSPPKPKSKNTTPTKKTGTVRKVEDLKIEESRNVNQPPTSNSWIQPPTSNSWNDVLLGELNQQGPMFESYYGNEPSINNEQLFNFQKEEKVPPLLGPFNNFVEPEHSTSRKVDFNFTSEKSVGCNFPVHEKNSKKNKGVMCRLLKSDVSKEMKRKIEALNGIQLRKEIKSLRVKNSELEEVNIKNIEEEIAKLEGLYLEKKRENLACVQEIENLKNYVKALQESHSEYEVKKEKESKEMKEEIGKMKEEIKVLKGMQAEYGQISPRFASHGVIVEGVVRDDKELQTLKEKNDKIYHIIIQKVKEELDKEQTRLTKWEAVMGSRQCQICFDRFYDTVFLKCGHHSCGLCYQRCVVEKDKTCPFCRKKVRGKVKMYGLD